MFSSFLLLSPTDLLGRRYESMIWQEEVKCITVYCTRSYLIYTAIFQVELAACDVTDEDCSGRKKCPKVAERAN